ncbi:MAG: sialidase family protein [Planctomycetota bacterium]
MIEKTIISTKEKRGWQGIPGIEIAENGRLWVTFFSGGCGEPHIDNEILLISSMDNGKTWSSPVVAAEKEGKTRAFDSCLWHDPDGKLWLFYNIANVEEKLHKVVARTTTDSNSENPEWSDEFIIELDVPYAFRLNKPTVLSTGEWILPVVHADIEIPQEVNTKYPWKNWFAGPAQRLGAAVSTDKGKNWKLSGNLNAPEWALENMVIEKENKTLWMLTRTGGGALWESFSTDKGLTWSKAKEITIKNPGSRFHIRRLNSGNLLLINHTDFTKNDNNKQARNNLAALISKDDGKSWSPPLFIDKRNNISYPDMIEDKDANLHIVYDRERKEVGEINYCVLREEMIVGK